MRRAERGDVRCHGALRAATHGHRRAQRQHAKTLATAIDGYGNAVVIWSEWTGNQPHGVFAAIHRP